MKEKKSNNVLCQFHVLVSKMVSKQVSFVRRENWLVVVISCDMLVKPDPIGVTAVITAFLVQQNAEFL